MDRGRIQGLNKFFEYPLLTQELVKLRTSNLAGKFIGPIHEKKPIQNLEENGAWAYPGTAQIFWVPPVNSWTGKATDFKLVGYIYGANPNKSPLKILEKKDRVRIQGLPKFFGIPYYLRNG